MEDLRKKEERQLKEKEARDAKRLQVRTQISAFVARLIPKL